MGCIALAPRMVSWHTTWKVNQARAFMEPLPLSRHQQLQHLVTRFAFSEIALT
jgi:hypothetical protein